MTRPLVALLFAALLSRPIAAQSAAPRCAPARTALVLAGGGAKGLAHIGLLQALDSAGIRPDLVVGTSMGAILGALWAGGVSGDSIAATMKGSRLQYLIRNYQPMVSASLGTLTPALVWERERSRWVLQAGAVREIEVSTFLSRLMLRPNLTARGDFDALPIPFRAVATDLDDRSVVVLAKGDLAQAVRASMSIPVLLRPVVIDGRTLVDGGLASNIPVGVARAMGAERVIVSTIASPRATGEQFDDPFTMTSTVFEYLWVQDSLHLRPQDLLVALPTAGFGSLDFRPETIDSLIRLGRRTATAALAGASCVQSLGEARRLRPLPMNVGSARIVTDSVRDRDALLRELALVPRAPLRPGDVGRGLQRLTAQERYRGFWLSPSGDSSRINFDVRVERAPIASAGIGFAFDHLMSGRVWLGGVERNFLGRDLEGTALLTTGTWRSDLLLTARRRARVGRRYLPVGGSLEAITEDVRLFDDGVELPSAAVEEFGALIGLRPLFEPGWSVELGADYRLWRQPNTPLTGSAGVRAGVRFRRSGRGDPVVDLEATVLDDWQRVRMHLTRADSIGGVEFQPRVRVAWGQDLPVHQAFPLGGLEGFAGLRMLESRGDRELYGALLVRFPLWQRLRGRFEPMLGMTGNGRFDAGTGALDGVLLFGARAGVEFDTPVGPVRVEQGFNNQGRSQALIRVGHWF